MYKIAKPFFIIVETPLHAGTGQELGIVDLPIQRERHTSFPKIESSGLKGSIREVFENKDKKETISLVFGPEEGDIHAGALGFTDARVLLFPVKSMKGIFAWITCNQVLERFKKDLGLCGINDFKDIEIPKINKTGECSVSNKDLIGINGNIILEEYTFKIKNTDAKKISEYISEKIGISEVKNKLVVLSDDDFRDFVNLSTEVITRTKINSNTGTVESGALFTEEYLPTETVLYSLALATPIFSENKGIFAQNGKKEEELVMQYFEKRLPKIIQIGGNATIGKGIVRTKIWGNKNE